MATWYVGRINGEPFIINSLPAEQMKSSGVLNLTTLNGITGGTEWFQQSAISQVLSITEDANPRAGTTAKPVIVESSEVMAAAGPWRAGAAPSDQFWWCPASRLSRVACLNRRRASSVVVMIISRPLLPVMSPRGLHVLGRLNGRPRARRDQPGQGRADRGRAETSNSPVASGTGERRTGQPRSGIRPASSSARRKSAGDRHSAARRNLVGRLLGGLYHCLAAGQPYNEAPAPPASTTPAGTRPGGHGAPHGAARWSWCGAVVMARRSSHGAARWSRPDAVFEVVG